MKAQRCCWCASLGAGNPSHRYVPLVGGGDIIGYGNTMLGFGIIRWFCFGRKKHHGKECLYHGT